MNKSVAVLCCNLQRRKIQQIAEDEFTAEMFNPIETRRPAHEATHIQTACAEHAHDYRTDETVTSSYENFHESSQTEALPIVVKTHEVIGERRTTVDGDHLAAHSVQQAATERNDAAGNLFCVDVLLLP